MKQISLIIMLIIVVTLSCHTNQKPVQTSNTNDAKALLIDGTWEANYVSGTSKPFAEAFPGQKPTISVESGKGSIQGNTGCNSFQGTVKIEGNKLSFPTELATTRKMCPDMSGEQAFLSALKKVTSYSVTEQGRTLNLIGGDIAVMRLVRK